MSYTKDTIAAIATPIGRGGIGVIRVSGPKSKAIAQALTRTKLSPRYAHYLPFLDHEGHTLDEGLAIWFPGPHSFTGEDVLELQGHGGPVVMDWLLKRCLALGARMARPGEFSERAFLNDKLDLTQAEAIADLIDADTDTAARNALNSLQGAFSRRIEALQHSLTQLRIYVEAAIDFPEEEIDFLSDGKVENDLQAILNHLHQVYHEAKQGLLAREGMTVVIAGRPNAGKSSLLNALAGRDTAIVTNIEGTTRDLLREHIQIDGLPLHIVDTAGLRDSPDEVEAMGIERAKKAIAEADRVLLLQDPTRQEEQQLSQLLGHLGKEVNPDKVTTIINKCDQTSLAPGWLQEQPPKLVISAKSGQGLELLKQHLKQVMGYQMGTEGSFTARRRHLDALERCEAYLHTGIAQLKNMAAGELLAEDLRAAQEALGEITGQMSADELLGKIFSSFCIGK